MNVHDSEKIAGIFAESGYGMAESVTDADVILINTCGVRQKAEQKFYSELGRLKKIKGLNPHLKIAVAGCIAQQKGNKLVERFPYVDFIFGPQNIDSVQKWINENNPPSSPFVKGGKGGFSAAINNNSEYHLKTLPIKRGGKVKAWVSIMHGCDNYCSYCIVPYTRGSEKSRPSIDIINEIKGLTRNGFKEITLLGQNVNSYGRGLSEKIDFPDLLKLIHEISGIERIRFVTSHPRDLSVKLIETIRDLPKICEHIHLPLQAGSDRVLGLMNRGYTYRGYKEKVSLLRSAIPGIAITTDIIVGFPGEDEKDFENTLTVLREIEYDGIFAFKYSKRSNTKALYLPCHIDEKTKSQRLATVLDLQADITYRKNKALEGKTLEVLVEGISETDKEKLTGRTRTNKIVNFYGDNSFIGNIVNVKILEAKQRSLYGERI